MQILASWRRVNSEVLSSLSRSWALSCNCRGKSDGDAVSTVDATAELGRVLTRQDLDFQLVLSHALDIEDTLIFEHLRRIPNHPETDLNPSIGGLIE